MPLKKKLLSIFTLGALLLATCAISADEPVKKEQTAPAETQTETPAVPQTTPAPDFTFHPEKTPEQMTQSYEGAFVKMIATVIGLVLFVVLTIWTLRKIGQGRFRGIGSNRSIQIVERKPLSPKSMLYLVEVGHQKFLIAESQLEVRNLGTIEELSETAADET